MIPVIIPAKAFERAKSRLSPPLSPQQRADFARDMLDHVLDVAHACVGVGALVVATDCPRVAAHARARDAAALLDPPGARGRLGPIVDAALGVRAAAGDRRALVLMSDLPRLRITDLDALVSAMRSHAAVLAGDGQQAGTNALGTVLPAAPTCFGFADSLVRHTRSLDDRGLRVAHICRPGLAYDLDTPEDLAGFRAVRARAAAVNCT